jgi:hypothetical protein
MQSQLRKQLLEHLRVSKPNQRAARKAANIQEQVLNTIFAEYLAATQRTCTLSVFLPEAAMDDSVPLSHKDMMSILQIQPRSPLYAHFHAALKHVSQDVAPPGAKVPTSLSPQIWERLAYVLPVSMLTECL